EHFQATSTPALLRGAASDWPAMSRWSVAGFADAFGHQKMVCDHRCGLEMRMADFWHYTEHQTDDAPLYLFDHRLAECPALRPLRGDYAEPAALPAAADLLEGLAPAACPPRRWLLVGPRRSGSALHKDPLGTSAWNALVVGTKLWVLFPPATPPEWLLPCPRGVRGDSGGPRP
ncbi:unnamed protein product, partial [Prorocentrum cordatum]